MEFHLDFFPAQFLFSHFLSCPPEDWICVQYKNMKIFFDDVEDAGDFIDLLRVAK